MGLRYAYSLVTAADAVDDLLVELATHLVEDDRESLLAALPWVPERERAVVWGSGAPILERRGIAGLKLRSDHEHPNNYCFIFAFPLDPELEDFERTDGYRIRGQHVEIGCIWTKLYVGEEHARLECMAASSGMSLAWARLPGIRAAWVRLAEGCRARALWLDTEDLDLELLYPEMRKVPSLNPDWFWSPDLACLRVDAYCEALLELARVDG